MGKRDVSLMDYLSDNGYFADMFDAVFYKGKGVIRAEELQEADKELTDPGGSSGENVRRDNVKKRMKGVALSILAIENQYSVDYHMVIRNLYSESLGYRKQWKEKKREHKEKRDLGSGVEFLSGMKREDKFLPELTLVVYYGEEPWDGPLTLHELLDFSGENEALKPYVADYELNIFDYHNFDSFENFKTQLREVFEFLRYSKEKEALENIIAKRADSYYNISNDTYRIIAELTKSEDLLKKSEGNENEGGEQKMGLCKALEDMKIESMEKGIEKGRAEGMLKGEAEGIQNKTRIVVTNMLRRGLSDEDICALAECNLKLVEELREKIQK